MRESLSTSLTVEIVHVNTQKNHMATTFDLTISCDHSNAQRALRLLHRCHAFIEQIESELTEFRPESPIYQLNHAATGVRVSLPVSACEILERAEALRTLTQGAFDCLAKSQIPSLDDRPIQFNSKTKQAWKTDPAGWLGLGAIGKGYALDRIRLLIEQEGFENYLLNAGGSSLILSGWAGQERPWIWGWSWKKDEQNNPLGLILTHRSGKPIAIGVSGLHEKGNHLIDPRISHLSRTAPATLSTSLVATNSAMDADALSTAQFILGFEDMKIALQQLPLTAAAAVITLAEVPNWNREFQKNWGNPIFDR